MDLRLRQLFFGSLCMVTVLQVSCRMSFTEDIPKSPIKATLGKDVSLGWSFSFNDLGGNPAGPFGAPDVYEITFGIYKSIHNGNFMAKKLVVVGSGGNFTVRDGYDSKMDWSYSKYKLTFTLKNFAIQDQAMYGVNVEFGLSQMPLKHSVFVTTGPSYVVQQGSSIVRNESAYITEDFDLSFTRSIRDRTVSLAKYTLFKNNIAILIVGKNRVHKKFSCYQVAEIRRTPCAVGDFSVNETYVSFKLRKVTLQDAGRYRCEKFLPGLHDTALEEINLNVQERPTVKTTDDETSTPGARSSYPVTIPSVVNNVSPGGQRKSEEPSVREIRPSPSQVYSPNSSPGLRNSSVAPQKNSLPWWGITLIVLVILILAGLSIFYIIYKRRRRAGAGEGRDNVEMMLAVNEEAPHDD